MVEFSSTSITMERATQNLQELLMKTYFTPLPFNKKKQIIIDVWNGISQMHSRGICSRDVKLENVVLVGETAKLIDFNLAHRVSEKTPIVGSLIYYSPEMADLILSTSADSIPDSGLDGFAIDVWASGVVFYAVFTQSLPMTTPMSGDLTFLYKKIAAASYDLKDPFTKDAEMCDLLRGIFEKDPVKRLTIAQILEHPWVTGGRVDKVFEIERTGKTSGSLNAGPLKASALKGSLATSRLMPHKFASRPAVRPRPFAPRIIRNVAGTVSGMARPQIRII